MIYGKRFAILKAFTDISVIIPEVGRYIARKATLALRYSLDEFVPLLMRIIPAIKLLGVTVFLPKSLESLIRPKPKLKLKKKVNSSLTVQAGLRCSITVGVRSNSAMRWCPVFRTERRTRYSSCH